MLSNRAEENLENEPVGWANFPIIIQKEEHPSCCKTDLFATKAATTTTQTMQLNVSGNESDLEENHKRKVHPSDVDNDQITTFGWSDFPLMVQEDMPFSPLDRKSTNEGSRSENAGEWKTFEAETPIIVRTPTSGPDSITSFGWSDFLPPCDKSPSCCPTDSPLPPRMKEVKKEVKALDNSKNQPLPIERETKVKFGQVRIRTHAIQLGDHPLCQSYPLALDWEFDSEEVTVDIAAYEETRKSCCWDLYPRRLTIMERRIRLAQYAGISISEVEVMERHRLDALAEEVANGQDHDGDTDDDIEEDDEPTCNANIPTSSLTRVPSVYGKSTKNVQPLFVVQQSVPSPVLQVQDQNLPLAVECHDDLESENFLEMSMHIGHAVNPGFEIQTR